MKEESDGELTWVLEAMSPTEVRSALNRAVCDARIADSKDTCALGNPRKCREH